MGKEHLHMPDGGAAAEDASDGASTPRVNAMNKRKRSEADGDDVSAPDVCKKRQLLREVAAHDDGDEELHEAKRRDVPGSQQNCKEELVDPLPSSVESKSTMMSHSPHLDNSESPTTTSSSASATITAGADPAQEHLQLRVAVIVPFRDNHAAQKRQAHLDKFVPHMTTLLSKQSNLSAFHIFVVEQSADGRKFNRGKLLNAGFDIARNDYDVFIFHDVDLLPGEDLGQYYAQKPELGPFHIARVWDRYNGNPKYFGGIVAFTRKDFIKINGFPNNFWGGTIADLEEMGLQEKLDTLRSTKWKCTVKRELLKEHARTWKKNGIKSLRYDFVDVVALNDFCTKITVSLGVNDHWSDDRSSLEHVPALEDASGESRGSPESETQENEEIKVPLAQPKHTFFD